ncbi:MAG TPA: PAS domain-containing protein, partial [Rhodocyclaceae bacterium]|nr:PAS domain-containing protein [Rhodocyclaceae bacterium]
MSTLNNRNSERALILAPLGRDAQIAAQILDEAGIESHPCPDLSCFVEELHAGAGFAVVTEDVLRDIDPLAVRQWISAQPSWSDLPILVLTAKGGGIERNPHARRLTEVLGNVVFLERPFHPTTFVSVARTALRGRRRQYRSRDDQDEIAESETRLRFALDAGHLGSWEFDLATRTLLCSRICKSNFGRQPHEVFTYEHLLSSIHPEDQARITAAVNKAIAEGGDYQVEYRIIWPNGTLHWIEVRGRRLISFDGDVTLLGVSLDITARREAEIALRLSEERYRTLIEALPQLVWTCLPDGRCNYLNRQWIEFTGVESSDPLDVNWLDVVHPLDRDRIREHW